MHKEGTDHSFQPTAFLNETYVRLVGPRENDWEDRHHFLAVAARPNSDKFGGGFETTGGGH
jgi:hypothetical protein